MPVPHGGGHHQSVEATHPLDLGEHLLPHSLLVLGDRLAEQLSELGDRRIPAEPQHIVVPHREAFHLADRVGGIQVGQRQLR